VTRPVRGYLTGAWDLFVTAGAAQRHNPPPMQLQQGPTIPKTSKFQNVLTQKRLLYELGARIEAGFLTKCEVFAAVLTFENVKNSKWPFFLNSPMVRPPCATEASN
jgi:hypothetical protein